MILNSPSQATKTNHQSQGSTHKTLATQPTTQIFRLGLINVLRKYYEARTLFMKYFFSLDCQWWEMCHAVSLLLGTLPETDCPDVECWYS